MSNVKQAIKWMNENTHTTEIDTRNYSTHRKYAERLVESAIAMASHLQTKEGDHSSVIAEKDSIIKQQKELIDALSALLAMSNARQLKGELA